MLVAHLHQIQLLVLVKHEVKPQQLKRIGARQRQAL
jgi:hypothetical protein